MAMTQGGEGGCLRGVWSRLIDLVSRQERGTSLALLRIASGLTVLAALLGPLFAGVLPEVWLPAGEGGYLQQPHTPWLFALLGGVHRAAVCGLIAAAVVGAALLTVGLVSRAAALVVLFSYTALTDINWHTGGCDDQLIAGTLWMLALSHCGATLSLGCRWRGGAWTSPQQIPAWPRYVLILQLVVVYFTTALHKVSIHWTWAGDYSALYYILQEPSWQRLDMQWLAWVYPLTQLGTATVWWWELAAPLLIPAIYFRRTRERPGRIRAVFNWIDFRRLYVALGLMMHLGIFVLIGLGPFTWITLSLYACLFHPDEWRGLFSRFRRMAGSQDSASARPRARPQTRPWLPRSAVAVFVIFHVAAMCLGSLPAPNSGLERGDFDDPVVEREMESWRQTLGRVGLDVPLAEFKDRLWRLSSGYTRVRNALLAPFQPYYRYLGVSQGWPMFVGPCTEPTRLHVDVLERGGWRPLFIESDRTARWRARQLAHEHVRTAIYTMLFFDQEDEFRQFAQWVARKAAADFPKAAQVRLRAFKFRTPTPEEIRSRAPVQGQFRHQVVVALDQFRDD